MKITLKDLEDLVITLIGEDVLPLVRILWAKNNISEFKLAEMLNITVNQVRNMLYRLNEQNLVNFIRKKDKKKGWYIYYWSLNKKSVEGSILKVKTKQVGDLKSRLGREQEGMFYVCPMGCMRLQMEQAMEHEFRCQECGTLMKEQDNQKTVSNIRKMIIDIESELKTQEEEKTKKTLQKKEREQKIIEKIAKKVLPKKIPNKKIIVPAKVAVKKTAVKKVVPVKVVKKAAIKKIVKKKL